MYITGNSIEPRSVCFHQMHLSTMSTWGFAGAKFAFFFSFDLSL
jgi:hypothetical protein